MQSEWLSSVSLALRVSNKWRVSPSKYAVEADCLQSPKNIEEMAWLSKAMYDIK